MADPEATVLSPSPTQVGMDPPAAGGGGTDEDETLSPVATPYVWDEAEIVPTEVLQLWKEVGHGIDKNQTVVWKSAVDSLNSASRHLATSLEARLFCEKYVGSVVGILAEQAPTKIGPHERTCVQDSLSIACSLVAADLTLQLARHGESILLEKVLVHVFNKKKNFYKGQKGVWQQNMNGNGFPEVRLRNIEKFRSAHGFQLLHTYLMERVQSEHAVEGLFPGLEAIQNFLIALLDSMSSTAAIVASNSNADNATVKAATALQETQEVDAIQISQAVMLHLSSLSDDALKKIPTEQLSVTLKALQRIFDRLVTTRRKDCLDFYVFWRRLVLTMISSPSLPVKLTGWEQVNEMIKAVTEHRPPPRTFLCSGAGATICNGEYQFAGTVTLDGYAQPGNEISYVRVVTTPTDQPGGGSTEGGAPNNSGLGGHVVTPATKKLTLFRCTMRSQQKWWFLSEADEEQPGTDRDIDYYQHKSKEHEEGYPPPGGWITCRNAGVNPPPTLTPIGVMVPTGEELHTLEHQLAQWAIENEIVEKVLGDTTIHREVVARSTELIKFLASMCTRDPDESVAPTDHLESRSSPTTDDMSMGESKNAQPNKYCLQTSHLLFAWKTCTRKADAAVSLQVYQLLVSILPLCPSSLANPLLQAIQRSLNESSEKRDYLFEVSEFCSALAALNLVDVSSNNKAAAVPGTALTEDVRAEVLNLLWSVLTHPGVSLLKTYDILKRYVTRELKVEPEGSDHRERFLQSCVAVLSTNAEIVSGGSVDEVQALRMVKLTRFILEACPRSQSDRIILTDSVSLPKLLFKELVASLERRNEQRSRKPRIPQTRRPSLTQTPGLNANDVNGDDGRSALDTRLRILRYAYGLSDLEAGAQDPVVMSASMLNTLWTLCSENPDEQQAVMVFVASASRPGTATQYDRFFGTIPVTNSTAQTELLLSAAFSEEVCYSVFLALFCSDTFNYIHLGEDGYRSFQFLFTVLRSSACPSDNKKTALDALWRVCLTAEKDSVASQAMKDLLTVYVRLQTASRSMENGESTESVEQMLEDETEESFGDRMFEVLERVKTDLEARVPSAERSVQRCMRILNTAIGRVESEGLTTASTLARLSSLCGSKVSLREAVKCLPHGMRGQACCRRIGILARRPQTQNQNASTYDNSSPRQKANQKFSLDVHPLETLASVKYKVALSCQCTLTAVRPIQINGRARVPDHVHMGINAVPEDTVMDELGVVQGCEIVFVIAERAPQNNANGPALSTQRSSFSNDLGAVFYSDDGVFANRLFTIVLSILGSLQWQEPEEMSDGLDVGSQSTDIHKLVWDLLLAMPTNESIVELVKSTHGKISSQSSIVQAEDSMEVEATGESLSQLLDSRSFDRSVYVLLTIDAFLQPAPEALSIFPADARLELEKAMLEDANNFRRTFVDAGGFGEVVRFFSLSGGDETSTQIKARRGNAVALRILKSCLFGNIREITDSADATTIQPDETGLQLLRSLSDTGGLLKSLTAMVVEDRGISSSTVADVLRFLRLLFQSPDAAASFAQLPDAEKFLIIVLMWDEGCDAGKINSSVSAAMHVRRNAHDLILQTSSIADCALPWLINAIGSVRVDSESTTEYFDVLEKLVSDSRSSARTKDPTDVELRGLASTVCKKLATCPRPGNETDLNDISTGVLCGCLKLLRALIIYAGGSVLRAGTNILLAEVHVARWSEIGKPASQGVLSLVSNSFSPRSNGNDVALIDLMGAIFDGFLSPGGSSSVAICCDKESRARGFDVVSAAAMECKGAEGYMTLANRIDSLVSAAAPKLRHGWGQFGGSNEVHSRNRVSKYSGLRNQGCTCYMNSFLQQLFMMPSLRQSMCSSDLPTTLRTVGGNVAAKGSELVGKKISLQWDTGTSFDAVVEAFDDATDMHTIRYCPMQIAVGASTHRQIHPEEVARLPPPLPDEFVLSEGRPGKETGVFEVVPDATDMETTDAKEAESESIIKESEDEAMSRQLLEEVQRTFIHLEQGSRGHCFDPRALVEACACLKLEFDVWQQNDASEFATKLLDRLEISLKKWAPENFRYMDHTFGLKQTKQKTCKKCGLKSSREEKLLNIDCQIRGKSDIHEALSAMTEIEIMEGSNQVYCDKCKENTDTILKSAISTLPNVLILSLKRFDLDYNTFETVKLNSRCAFGQTLNMKQYSLDALEVLERAEKEKTGESSEPNSMETEENGPDGVEDPLASLPDENYEYRLVGVLVHAGVAQGGHYYSFIKDRISGSEEKWYRFDDEDVTPFDPALIETECFGGKVKKETKWPNGQLHTVEQEQFANALMVFYEKVVLNEVPSAPSESSSEESEPASDQALITKDYLSKIQSISGYDVFEPDVRRSNETHQWQAFLFDSELQNFLKGMLRMCRQHGIDPPEADADHSWRATVLQTLLTFMFDVLMYSSDCSSLNEWSRVLEEILLVETAVATSFTQKLAKKTGEISSNWLRTYIMDCPDHVIRAASLRVFMAAIRSVTRSDVEKKLLVTWVRGWRDLLAEITTPAASSVNSLPPYPCALSGKYSALEDKEKIGTGASSLGIIISFVNTMLEAVTRCWRFSSELCHFVRFLSSLALENGEMILRRPMIDAQVPARIIALIARERVPSYLRNAFPGASVGVDVANTQMRAETNPNAHLMPMNGNQGLNSSDLNSPRCAGHMDYISLFESLLSLAGIPGTSHIHLITRESEDMVRGRQWFALTDDAIKALTMIFQESCAPGAAGMGQREIELYLHRSGVDTNGASTQKIHEMLSKYPTTSGSETERGNMLSLEGFIAYYRDCVQSNDVRLRVDLHAFGFRPNLSRRSEKARHFKIGERDMPCPPVQSVCWDVAEAFENRRLELGHLANFALANCPYLYNVAHEVCEPLMQYLLAASTTSLNVNALIERTLTSLYTASNEWEVTAAGCSSMLQVFACTPGGEDQVARVHKIMMCPTKPVNRVDFGSGVLIVLRALHHMRQTQHWSSEALWTYNRYMHIVKDLYNLYPVYSWAHDDRNVLGFLERELLDSRQASTQNMRSSDYGPREQETQISLDHNTNSDSDMGGMHDSDDDDEDSQYDTLEMANAGDGPALVTVQGAGNPAVNGVYKQDGYFEGSMRYVMDGYWQDKPCKKYIFSCNVSNNTKHWYISIVPFGFNPGTSSDIDFYTAPITAKSVTVPPKSGWSHTNLGVDPPPILVFHDVDSAPERIGNGTIIENDIDEDQNSNSYA